MPLDSLPQRRLRILTWQVHGNYLYYLAKHLPHELWLVTMAGNPQSYAGRTAGFDWGDNVHEIAPQDVRHGEFDCVLYQSRMEWITDRETLLSAEQRRLPTVYLEHDPPQNHPSNSLHWAREASVLVQVTPFNALMWDCGHCGTQVIEHGVPDPGAHYTGELDRGIVVINHLLRRGRRLGADLYLEAQKQVPLTLVGMGSDLTPGGVGEIAHRDLVATMARHRFLYNPIRWTSLGLAVVEAMLVGLPVIGLATTELSTIIRNGENGWLETDPKRLIPVMQRLIAEPDTAREWGAAARRTALARFDHARFTAEWDACLRQAVATA